MRHDPYEKVQKRLSSYLGVSLDSYDESMALGSRRILRFSFLLPDGKAISLTQIERVRWLFDAKDVSLTMKADTRYADQNELLTLVSVEVQGVTFLRHVRRSKTNRSKYGVS